MEKLSTFREICAVAPKEASPNTETSTNNLIKPAI